MPLGDFYCTKCNYKLFDYLFQQNNYPICPECNIELVKKISFFNFKINGFNFKNGYSGEKK